MPESPSEWDAIVVGAGIAGASAAYHFSEIGRVLVLEKESQPGYHTTGRSAAFFTETYGNPVVRALTVGSRAFFGSPPSGFSDVPLWRPRPFLYVGRNGQEDSIDRLHSTCRVLAKHVGLADEAEARRRFPPLRAGYMAAAMTDDGAMELDVNAIHQGFLRGLKTRGGSVVCDAEVTGLGRGEGVWIADTTAGRFAAPVIVNAAGAWGDALAALAGADPADLKPLRRTIIVFDSQSPSEESWNMLVDADEAFYVRPESGGLLASPCDETPSEPCDAQPEEIDVARAADQVEQATDRQVQSIRRKWAGLRTFAPDRSPVAGFDPRLEGFFWLVGQGGFGIMTSPALGRTAAALIAGRGLPPDLRTLGLLEADIAPGRSSGA